MLVGSDVGFFEGSSVGFAVGFFEGLSVGPAVGFFEGLFVGFAEGLGVTGIAGTDGRLVGRTGPGVSGGVVGPADDFEDLLLDFLVFWDLLDPPLTFPPFDFLPDLVDRLFLEDFPPMDLVELTPLDLAVLPHFDFKSAVSSAVGAGVGSAVGSGVGRGVGWGEGWGVSVSLEPSEALDLR